MADLVSNSNSEVGFNVKPVCLCLRLKRLPKTTGPWAYER